jgi:hypothetical protein
LCSKDVTVTFEFRFGEESKDQSIIRQDSDNEFKTIAFTTRGTPDFKAASRHKICSKEWHRAVDYLVGHYKRNTFIEAREVIEKEGPSWWVKRHLGFGMGVRNALCYGGFYWRSDILDDTWYILFEEATKKFFEVQFKR